MAKTESVHARLDPELKANVESILKQLGLSSSDVVNLLYKQIELNRGLPFEIKLPQPNAETIAAIEEARLISNELKSGKRTGYADMDSLRRALEE